MAIQVHSRYNISLAQGNILFDTISLFLASLLGTAVSYVLYCIIIDIFGLEIFGVYFLPIENASINNLLPYTIFFIFSILISYSLGRFIIYLNNINIFNTDFFYGPFYGIVSGKQQPSIQVSVITNICFDGRYIGYVGLLNDIKVSKKEKIDYVILIFAERYYLDFGKKKSSVSGFDMLVEDGGDNSKLMIKGEEIKNIWFDPFAVTDLYD